ncbi:PQQ-binding-like beta-propeller repeat protein [Alienimonas californiensis]|uniref:Outer membrane protein assembly factor BamB n=1 Tax=Alienimonas californiensis TaxID=2527989 RepID=A0A517P5S6_9PLAN|nr:PQQ-binding-like beta-propeller repeat protein [Alienimonas californiensis]QDT14721.1 Outer membrane protein assembly factor BamB precursor [Alienimonas californiensis]
MSASLLPFAVLLLAAGPAGDASTGWDQWRGPTRDGRTAVTLPASLDEATVKEAWRVPLGASYSGPVLGPDGQGGTRVYTTEAVGNTFEAAKAFDAATGKLLWETQWKGYLSVPFFAKANGDWIRSTPALQVDENGQGLLYVAGMRDVLVALDAATGAEHWRVDFAARADSEPEMFGHVASPLVHEGAVYAHTIAGFSKLDAASGEVLWTVLGGDPENDGAFSSPFVATIGGTPQILVQARTKLCGVDPADGEILWSEPVPAMRGMNVLTPTVLPADGRGDAVRILTSSNGGGTMLYEVTKRGDEDWTVATVWENNRQGYMSSPVVIDGIVYQHLKTDRVVCYDVKTGEAAWTSTPFGSYWSMVTDGKRILALDADGDLMLIAADPTELKVLDERHVTDATSWAHVAVADKTGTAGGGRILVRALDELIALEF